MRLLIITPEVDKRIAEIIAYSKAHPFTEEMMKEMIAAEYPAGDNEAHVIEIPMGYRVVYTIEQQPEPVGLVVHMSFSVDGPEGAMPNEIAVREIARSFGVTNEQQTIGLANMWLEKIDYGGGHSINFLWKVEITDEWREIVKEDEADV